MIDKNILNAQNTFEYEKAIFLPAEQSKLNTGLLCKKERADLRLSFLILKNTREEFYSG